MLKIIIVDDEPFVLEMFQTFMNWNEINVEIVGTAPNGIEALNLIRSNHIDVVLTDLKMPIMDGLELVSAASTEFPLIQFIALSAYSDFHMVKLAFKLGIVDYILKSEVTPEQITEIIKQCAKQKQIQEDEIKYREESLTIATNLKNISNYKPVVRNKLFENSITYNWDYDILIRKANDIDINLQGQLQVILILEIDNSDYFVREVWNNERHMFDFAINNILNEIISENENTIFLFSCERDKYSFALFGNLTESKLLNKVSDLYKTIKTTLYNYLHMNIIAGISNPRNSSQLTPSQMYRQANISIQSFFIYGKSSLLNCGLIPSNIKLDFTEQLKNFSKDIYQKNFEKVQNNIQEFQFLSKQYTSEVVTKSKELFNKYYSYLDEYRTTSESTQALDSKMDYFKTYLVRYGTLLEYNRWLEDIVSLCVKNEFNSVSLIKRAKKYIMANYNSDITLYSVADVMGVNSSYLSRLFCKEEQMGFSEYVNRLRISIAIDLIEKSQYKLYEIAFNVGYNSIEHFSRVFKKFTGKKPSDYFNISE